MNEPVLPKRWQAIDGVLLLDKPIGMTSNAALQKARRLFLAAKAGHAGTLDPLATGLLPLLFGEAAKFSADLLNADKTYEAEICFGVTTDTGDREGAVMETTTPPHDLADRIKRALPCFLGEQLQTPPMYSAIKHHGRPLYELARQGMEVERAPRRVVFYALEPCSWDLPRFSLRVKCSKGAYIRTLAEDLGRAAGCGAHLTALRRVQVGALEIRRAYTLETLASLSENERLACLGAVDSLLARLPMTCLDAAETRRFLHGNPVTLDIETQPPGATRVYGKQEDARTFLGLGDFRADHSLWPRRLIAGLGGRQVLKKR
ncbi:MAG: tRNA pseudouridine(55) synthase TruB [Zoogloeaceae bacterium]|jgi:tRNA pseudouridine55 synthase|nr:tRNA pseudouridine(55) synthase TruB [Zoogloeaceae bacterium]